MVAGLENVIASGVAHTVDVILKRDTYGKLPDAMRWLADRGAKSVHLWLVSLTDQNQGNVASLPKMTDVVPFAIEAFRFGEAHGIDVRSLHLPRCLLGAPENVAHAFDPGADDVRVVTPEATFELRRSKITGQVHVPACEGCAHREICPGLREDYLDVYGDAEIAAARGAAPARGPRRSMPLA
jgi:cyclic pyranopterin phosphate synthase